MGHAIQDRWTIGESSDKTWSSGRGNDNPHYYSCCENPMNSTKRQKDMTIEDAHSKSEDTQYATGEEWRAIANISRKNEMTESKWKQH